MDIDYLLWLQGVRESLGQGVEKVVAFMGDEFGIMLLIAAALITYWCVDKRTGVFVTFSFCVGNLIAQVAKCIACVYRPWILDERIKPAVDALDGATGYSFPSGHTVSAATILGSLAYAVRKKHVVVSIVLVIVVLFVGFSRNYLGVHTPQDVIVALLLSLAVVLACSSFTAWLEEHREHDTIILLVAVLVGVVALAVVSLKPYPMDYANGVLLVDPVVMQKDCFEGIGLFVGLFAGWYCERRWVNFVTTGLDWKARVVRLLIGLAFVALIMLGIDPLLKMVLDARWAKLVSRLLVAFCALFVAPLVFNRIAITRGSSPRYE